MASPPWWAVLYLVAAVLAALFGVIGVLAEAEDGDRPTLGLLIIAGAPLWPVLLLAAWSDRRFTETGRLERRIARAKREQEHTKLRAEAEAEERIAAQMLNRYLES